MRAVFRWIGYALLFALVAILALQFWYFAHIWYWADHNPGSTAFMRARLEVESKDDPGAELAHRWVSYDRISRHLKRAVVAAEDDKFMDHSGFDWDAMRKAYERNVREGEIVAGASTIPQQLAKNLFLTGRRSWWRKLQEAGITAMLEIMLSKRRILELYLNVAEWGDGVFGAEAAARYHYGVSAAALTPAQSARLAVMLPSPRSYPPGRDTLYLRERTAAIMGRMQHARVP
ncbi:MAG TPA: monofunctional biosynthetic peptidoglycan transglycosylase [Burkholderiales bacterium]|nr:monofunctional biosynthetic peptidoglycan transglycosylase [Burkholderiales bacterium]